MRWKWCLWAEFIKEPLMRHFGMPARDELQKAGFDPDAYVKYDEGWYDGSIRAMDVEIARLNERLRGLDNDTLFVFLSDHGEEFLDHGRMFLASEFARSDVPRGVPEQLVYEDRRSLQRKMANIFEVSALFGNDARHVVK